MHFKKLQSVSNCCILRLDSNLGNGMKAKGKDSECRKGEICQYFNRAARDTNIMEGVAGKSWQKPATLILSFKHTPRMVCLNNKAKCYNLPPPGNIRCITSKRCKVARKDIDWQRKEEKCSAS